MSNKLDQIQIPKSCPADWEEMTGSDRVRYCEECKKHVYNLSKMTRREAESLIASRQGSLCARIVLKPDGTILTEEIAASSHSTSRRALPVATAVVTAILTLGSSAVAQQPAFIGKPVPAVAKKEGDKKPGDKKPDNQPQTGDGSTSIAGTVFDLNGAVIVGATVRLKNKQTGEEHLMKTSDEGVYRFTQIEAGAYSIKVESSGFRSAQVKSVAVQQGEKISFDVTMEVAAMGEIVDIGKLPLRLLYSQSELIVVARVANPVQIGKEGQARLMKTRLEITSTLKGADPEGPINLYQWVYAAENEIYASGDTLLLFLNARTEDGGPNPNDGFIPADSLAGIKRLAEADLQVYLQRIGDLTEILRKENNYAEIAEWLVRCAEHPATRGEGVFEFARRTYVLNSEQKERVIQALFNTQNLTKDDVELIMLVNDWDKVRLISFLLEQLKRNDAGNPKYASELALSIAAIIDDNELGEVAAQYAELADSEEESEENRRQRSEMLRSFIALVESRMKK